MMELTPELLLGAYAQGIFPMAEDAASPGFFWVEPRFRGVIAPERFTAPRRLKRTVRSSAYDIRIDHDFPAVIRACAEPAPGRETTWINTAILRLYDELFHTGHAHSVEVYDAGTLIGGLYGVRLGGVFFGESMFHRARDASKIALVHLIARLIAGGFRLLDTQFLTTHLAQFGAEEIPQTVYLERLEAALAAGGDWSALTPEAHRSGSGILRVIDGGHAVE
ncbi:MAG: leucyl/phenylalanyl-tRNA--protein transferase [Methylobacteriaceae bacterium]|jgi:leucyl/phenylalanyl-tRNA--protein transferase|nr:leucyl/phenylalanyl-tRNA--protein transferase [Methylobacteriaceae bacterium]